MRRAYNIFLICFITSAIMICQVLNVPEHFKSIQTAIDFSSNGDTILVADGTYYENINFKGKKITVASHLLVDADYSHIIHTIIDGSKSKNLNQSSVVYFMSAEDTNSILYGFTITGGKGTHSPPQHKYNAMAGGGILISKSGAKILNNNIAENKVVGPRASGGAILIETSGQTVHIINNFIERNEVKVMESHGGGAGIFCLNCDEKVLIRNNVFSNNSADDTDSSKSIGGAIKLINSHPIIKNNLIKFNYAGFGGGIGTSYPITLNQAGIENNTVVYNKAKIMGGGIYNFSQKLMIRNCILWQNYSPTDPQIVSDGIIEYSNIEGGCRGENIIIHNPQFADTTFFHLKHASPCVDAGNPELIFNDAEDINKAGFALFPSLGKLRNDLGMYGGPNSKNIRNIRNDR